MAVYTININRKVHQVSANGEMPLLWVIRDKLGLVGTKYGCGIGQCGVCTVLMNGDAIKSCLIPLDQIGDAHIVTIEGISEDGYHPVQQAWIDEQVPQCGYCQSGQIMQTIALLNRTQSPDDEEIRRVMSAVLCRCGTYQRIQHAVRRSIQLLGKPE